MKKESEGYLRRKFWLHVNEEGKETKKILNLCFFNYEMCPENW